MALFSKKHITGKEHNFDALYNIVFFYNNREKDVHLEVDYNFVHDSFCLYFRDRYGDLLDVVEIFQKHVNLIKNAYNKEVQIEIPELDLIFSGVRHDSYIISNGFDWSKKYSFEDQKQIEDFIDFISISRK